MRQFLIIAALVVAIVLIALIWIPIPYTVQKTLSAVELRHDDPDYLVPRQITIDGTYHFYLYKYDRFTGTFEIEGYPQTIGHETIETIVTDKTGGILAYANDEFLLEMLGFILAESSLDRIFIGVYENNGWSGGDGLSIIAPATTRAEALAVWETLSRGNEWLGATTWGPEPLTE